MKIIDYHRYVQPKGYIIIIIMPQAQISLTLSRHFSLSFIASGKSSFYRSGLIYYHHVVLLAWISQALSPFVSINHCFWRVHETTSLVCTELLSIGSCWPFNTYMSVWRGPKENVGEFVLTFQQFSACLVHLIWMVLEIRVGKCPYRCCLVGCCFQDLFEMARSILDQLPCSFFFLYA